MTHGTGVLMGAAADLRWSRRGGGWGGEGGEVEEGEPHPICCAFVACAERVDRTLLYSPVPHARWGINTTRSGSRGFEVKHLDTHMNPGSFLIRRPLVLLLIINLSHRDTCRFLLLYSCNGGDCLTPPCCWCFGGEGVGVVSDLCRSSR